jgi:ATPases with chaperone activity, ATP-binding subunit
MDRETLNTQALIDAVAERASSSDPLVLLETALTFAALAGQSADAMVDHYVETARAAGLSWTVIGDRLGISKQAARQRFSPRLEVSGGPATEPAALAPRLTACLEAAQAAADADDSVPGTQHLLLGLLHVGAAANILDKLGVTRAKVRESSTRLLDATGGGEGARRVVGDGEAEAAVVGARRFAANRGQDLAQPQHLLFTLALDPGSSARRILDDLGVDPAQVKKELSDLIPPPPRPGRRGRRTGKHDPSSLACSFCGCTDPHRSMVNGPGVRICGACVALASDIIKTSREQATRDLTLTGRLLG